MWEQGEGFAGVDHKGYSTALILVGALFFLVELRVSLATYSHQPGKQLVHPTAGLYKPEKKKKKPSYFKNVVQQFLPKAYHLMILTSPWVILWANTRTIIFTQSLTQSPVSSSLKSSWMGVTMIPPEQNKAG